VNVNNSGGSPPERRRFGLSPAGRRADVVVVTSTGTSWRLDRCVRARQASYGAGRRVDRCCGCRQRARRSTLETREPLADGTYLKQSMSSIAVAARTGPTPRGEASVARGDNRRISRCRRILDDRKFLASIFVPDSPYQQEVPVEKCYLTPPPFGRAQRLFQCGNRTDMVGTRLRARVT
jgi:hypothetical protein